MTRCTLAHGVLCFLCTISMFNFIDRGIITGAPKEFGNFVTQSLGVPSSEQGKYLGLMTSAFVGCYSIASVSFGHAIHLYPKFVLLCIGLAIWVVALFLSGVAHYIPASPATFWFFIGARALSGVGEAAFQCIVPPYVDDFAPAGSKSLWLSLFYTAIPTGTALGYLFGASMGETAAGWGAAFMLEAFLMAPFVVFSLWLPSPERLAAGRQERRTSAQTLIPEEGSSYEVAGEAQIGVDPLSSEAVTGRDGKTGVSSHNTLGRRDHYLHRHPRPPHES